MMNLELFGRDLKLGDIVVSDCIYTKGINIYVVIGFTNKNVRVCNLSLRPTIKPAVTLIEDGVNLLDALQLKQYKEVCKIYKINI